VTGHVSHRCLQRSSLKGGPCSVVILGCNGLQTNGVILLTKAQASLLRFVVEVHRLSADNRYQPFDNRHRPIIGRLFVLVSKTTKMLSTAVHIDDNEVINGSQLKTIRLVKLQQECYQFTIVPL